MVYYVLLGGNEGDVDEKMAVALEMMNEGDGHVVCVSSIYESPAWGYDSALPYHNAAAKVVTPVGPFAFLSFLKHAERRLGRLTKTEPGGEYHDRPIDLDILLCDDNVVNTETLAIPHPKLPKRRFALTPLAEIASEVYHPLLKKTILEMLIECEDASPVTLAGNLRELGYPTE